MAGGRCGTTAGTTVSAVAALLLAGQPAGAAVQGLTDTQLRNVRRGAAAVELDGSASVPLLGPAELPLVEVELNGRGPYRLLVDLGSNVTGLRRDVLDEVGGEIVVEREGTDVGRIERLAIGEAVYPDVWLASWDVLDVDGVLGYNLLSLSSFELDFAERRLTLDRAELVAGPDVLPLTVDSRLPYIPARVAGRELLLNLDTGASNWIVFPAAAADSLPLLGPPAPGPKMWNNQTGTVRVSLARLDGDLAFGRHLVPNPVVIFDPDVEDAWIGAALLREFGVRVDPGNARIRLAAADTLHRAPPWRTLGFSLEAAGAARVVDDVVPGTPAVHALSRGDTVVSVADRSGTKLDGYFLRHLADTADAAVVRWLAGSDTAKARLPVAEVGMAPVVHGSVHAGVLQTLREARRAFSDAYMRGDTDAIAAAYVERPAVLPPDREIRDRGSAGRYFALPSGVDVVHHAMEPETIWADDELVVEEGRWIAFSRRPDGSYGGGAAPYVVAWRRGDDGRWRMVLDMWHR